MTPSSSTLPTVSVLRPEVQDLDHLPLRDLLRGLRQRLAEVVRDGKPVGEVSPWLQATMGVAGELPGALDLLEASPQDVVHLAVTSRRTDLLDAVLRVPAFRRSTLMGLPLAIAHPDPAVKPWGTPLAPLVGPMDEDPLLARMGQSPLPRAYELERSWRLLQQHQPMLAGFRVHSHTNLMGLAVMMGWTEGVSTLLAHGVDPYAVAQGSTPELLLSPLMLAAHYQDAASAAVLLGDASLDLLRPYGFSETLWIAKGQPGRSMVLAQRDTVGGLELDAVLDTPALIADPRVIQAVGRAHARWTPLVQHLDQALSPARRQALEGLLLRHLVADGRDAPLDARDRPRL